MALLLAGLPVSASASASVPTAEAATPVLDGRRVTTTVTVPGLSAADTLDLTRLRVSSGGRTWAVTGTAQAGTSTALVRTAVLCVDTSGSMGDEGIAAARAAAERFLEVAPADVAVGLVTFADETRVVVEPTRDRQRLREGLAAMTARGETRLYDGVGEALTALGPEGERALVVLSDGADTASAVSLDSVATALTAAGVDTTFVGFRTEEGQVAVLADLAGRTGGRVAEASTGTELSDVFSSAASALVHQVQVSAEVPTGVTGAVDLVIEVPTTAGAAVATLPVDLSGVPPVTEGTVAAAPRTTERGVPWLFPAVLAVCFAALLLLTATALTPGLVRPTTAQRRSRQLAQYRLGAAAPAAATAAVPSAVGQRALQWADRTLQERGAEETWRLALDRAAVPLQPHEWLLLRLGAALAGLVLGWFLLPWWLLTAPLAGLVGYAVPGLYLRVRTSLRLRRFADDLPDVLQLVAGSLRSGFSLTQALDNAAKQGQEPAKGEFARALAEARLGVPLEDTLDRVAVRMRSTDLTWTVMAMRISREVGGNLAEVLLSTAETMRERGRLRRQVRTLSAEGRLSAYVLLGLPVCLTLWMVAFRGSYIAPLVTEPIGWVMTAYGVLSVAVGAFWMSRLVKMEV